MNKIQSPTSKKSQIIYSDESEDDFFTHLQPRVESITLSHLNNKSSVLCPESQDITSQYLVLQQLDAHQRMISRAKGVVDTSPPKSLKSYISISDRKKQRQWRKMHSESPGSNLYDSSDEYSVPSSSRNHFEPSKQDEMESLMASSVNKGIQTGIPFSSFRSTTADKISWYLEALRHGEILSHPFIYADTISSLAQQSMNYNHLRRQSKKVKGDIMERHQEQFVKPKKPFCPRILAHNHAKSKLKEMRCYNPPFRRKKNISSSHSSDTFDSYDEEEENEVESCDKAEVHPHKDSSSMEGDTLVNQKHFKKRNYAFSEDSRVHHNSEHYSDYTNSQRVSENEEDKCLSFLSKVTEDILRSGVYSDRAIQRAFNFHMQFYQKDSNQEKLQSLLEQVLEGLKISSDESEDVYELVDMHQKSTLQCSQLNTPPQKEKTDNFTSFAPFRIGEDINTENENMHTMDSVMQNGTVADQVLCDEIIVNDELGSTPSYS